LPILALASFKALAVLFKVFPLFLICHSMGAGPNGTKLSNRDLVRY
jgi:hypothetical protein